MADDVELGVVRDGVAEAYPDGLIDVCRAIITTGHELLHLDEFFRERKFRVKLDARWLEQPSHRLLREILNTATHVAGPLINGRIRSVVNRREGQFVHPGGDVAFGRDVADRLAGAERHTEHGVLPKSHRTGQRRHLSVVHHVEGNVFPCATQLAKQTLHPALEKLLRHATKEGSDLHAVVHIHPCAAAADGIDARQMRRGLAQRIHDLIEVPLRVGLRPGIPHRLIAEDRLAVNHRGDFAIAGTEIKADTAAVPVTSQRRALFAGGRHSLGCDHGDSEGSFVDFFTHQLRIEATRIRVAIVGG